MSLTFEWLQRRPSRNGGWPTFTLFVKVGAEPAARAPDGYEYGKGRWTRCVRSGLPITPGGWKNSSNRRERTKRQLSGEPVPARAPYSLRCLPRVLFVICTIIGASPLTSTPIGIHCDTENCSTKHNPWDDDVHSTNLSIFDSELNSVNYQPKADK